MGVVVGGAAGAGQVDDQHAKRDGGGVAREAGGELGGVEGLEGSLHAVQGEGVRRTGGVKVQHLGRGRGG